jgi:hypothetical protein
MAKKRPVIERQVNFNLDKYLYPIDNAEVHKHRIKVRFRVWKDIIVEKNVKLSEYDGSLNGVDKLIDGKKLYLKTDLSEHNGVLNGSILVVGLKGSNLGYYLKHTERK